MIKKWEEMRDNNPDLAEIIQKGLDKLGTYQERIEKVPAYVLAMRTSNSLHARSTISSDYMHMYSYQSCDQASVDKHLPSGEDRVGQTFVQERGMFFLPFESGCGLTCK